MSDALKMLPLPVERRVELALSAIDKIYPKVDLRAHIIGDPITVSSRTTRIPSASSRARCPATTATTTACTVTSCRRFGEGDDPLVGGPGLAVLDNGR